MSNYTAFAEFYDQLTDNVDYKKRAEYFCKLLERHGHTMGPVSYTHLDVYKRQKLHRELLLQYGMCPVHRRSFMKKILGEIHE